MKTLLRPFILIVFLFATQFTCAQNFTVTGFVMNHLNGEKVKNASVFESADGIGTISNDEGYFKLVLKPGNKCIKISDSGFEVFSKKISLQKDTVLQVHLKPEKIKEKHSDEAISVRVANDEELNQSVSPKGLRIR